MVDTDTQRVRLEQLCRNRVVGWRLSEGASVAADGERGGDSDGHRYTVCAPGAAVPEQSGRLATLRGRLSSGWWREGRG